MARQLRRHVALLEREIAEAASEKRFRNFGLGVVLALHWGR
jgi:hypothetical protein